MKRLTKATSIALALGTAGTLLASVSSGAFAATRHDSLPTGQHITVFSHLTPQELSVMQKLANAWGKQTGNTVTVVQDNSSFQNFATASRSGKGPDIELGIPHDNLGTFAIEGVMAPVPAGLINTKDYIKPSIQAGTIGGKLYGIPLSSETYGLFYNKKIIKTPPKTWAQFISEAKAHGFAYDINNFYYSYAFIGGMGGYVFGNNHGVANVGQIGLDNAGAIKGLSIIKSFVSQYHFMPASITGDIAKSLFQNGKSAFYISGPWDVSSLLQAHVKFGIAPLPLLPNGRHPVTFEGFQEMIVNARSHNQALDWNLVKYISQHAAAQELAVGDRIPVLVKDVHSKMVSSNPYAYPFAIAAQYGVPMPNVPQMQAVWTPAGNALSFVTKGQESPAVAAHNMVKQILQGESIMGN
ncbi:maltose ABC transporter substrate-binding protein [Ferroacidibacillus organovorans]|uniref:Maltodextrin-binding protein n=1 Tax=Ferroacidibacillus organovorans TaxID=1765683 RepID=A0A101XRA6_9BACL|nr:maltose ABC transporter substrate-binding protein [Ferroacidibacillus organovorans]KUO96097.1 hypothetical protein ATW55_01645 [Ferroacidibacillus organovorans]